MVVVVVVVEVVVVVIVVVDGDVASSVVVVCEIVSRCDVRATKNEWLVTFKGNEGNRSEYK